MDKTDFLVVINHPQTGTNNILNIRVKHEFGIENDTQVADSLDPTKITVFNLIRKVLDMNSTS
ncbi:hypothetical protein HHI36_011491, partial [Cryptolaemus montrouzieri]